MSIRFLNNRNNGTATATLNVFNQLEEPTNKNGIWLKSSNNINIVNYIDTLSPEPTEYVDIAWDTVTSDSDFTGIASASGTVVGDYIYILVGKVLYRCDITLNSLMVYDNLELTAEFKFIQLISEGNYLYIFGGESSNQAYKYNVETKVLTALTNVPNSLGRSGVCNGDKGEAYLCATKLYKYNMESNKYVELATLPFVTNSSNGKSDLVYIKETNKLYYLGTTAWNAGSVQFYEYDLSTNTWKNLGPISSSYYWMGNMVAHGTNIIIHFVDNNKSSTNTYWKLYDTLTNTFHGIQNQTTRTGFGIAVIVDNKILYVNENTLYSYVLPIIYAESDTMYIASKAYKYRTKLIGDVEFPFNIIYITDNTGKIISDVPIYYGNGTEWIQIAGGEL